jgi:hypothetical protein
VTLEIAKYQNAIMSSLRAACHGTLRDEVAAWDAIQASVTKASDPLSVGLSRAERLRQYSFGLALIYSHQTGAMPGFSNAENETRFERFVHAIPVPAGLRLTRYTLKYAIRLLDAKHNDKFLNELNELNEMNIKDAAE